MHDVIIDETEMSVAVNKLTAYADFLARSIESYVNVLDTLSNEGINDTLICEKIDLMKKSISPYKKSVSDAARAAGTDVTKFMRAVEKADRFVFPG